MSFRVSVTVNSALARRLHLLLNMASVCYDCEQQYTFDHFNSIISHSADVSFRQTITHGCLCKLLAWAKAKKQSNKSSSDELPSDLTGIAHAVIKTIHTCGASSSSDPLLQLKSTLPAFNTLHRSVTRALAAGNANCCLIAQCLYEPSSALQTSTPAERKRASSWPEF